MPTASQLRRMAQQDRAAATALRARADAHERQAAELERLADMSETALRDIEPKRSMLGSKMELQNAGAKSKRVKIAATMSQETPAKKALFAANVTPQQVADELGVGRSTVNAWCNGSRSIPRQYVTTLGKKHRIAASVWPKIAD